jgi:HTH-type transcriptional regulator/antitoxin HigA
MMNIQPVHTEAAYNATLKEISRLMAADPALGTPDGDRLYVPVTLVQAYEARHHPMNLPDPIDAIRFRMEQQGLTIEDLEPMISRSNRVYEVLNGERRLTLNMIRRLHKGLGIPAEVLIGRDDGFGLAA